MQSGGALNLSAGNIITNGTDAFAGTLNVLGFTGGTAELTSYTSYTGGFQTVTGLTSGYQLYYGTGQLDIIAAVSGPTAWLFAASGSWNDTAKWSNNTAPNGSGQTAIVGAATNAPLTINLDNPQTLGTLVFTNTASSAAGYTLSAGSAGSLTLDNAGSTAQIVVNGGSHGIAAPVYLTNSTLEVSASNSGMVAISGGVSDFGAGASLTLDGDGTGELVLSSTNTFGGPGATATVSSGTLVLTSSEALADETSLTVGDASLFGGIQPAEGAAVAAGSSAPAGVELVPVPEPSTLALVIAGVAPLAFYRRRKKG
jgi:hypothetical protein